MRMRIGNVFQRLEQFVINNNLNNLNAIRKERVLSLTDQQINYSHKT